MSSIKFLGMSDHPSCECCGRKNLKRTVRILLLDSDTEVFYGTSCAARAFRMNATDVTRESMRADRMREEAERTARALSWAAEDARWQAFLDTAVPSHANNTHDGKSDRFAQIAALGGSAAARAAYRAAVSSDESR